MQQISMIWEITPVMPLGEPFKVICCLISKMLITTHWTMKLLTDADREGLMYQNISEHLDWPSLDVIYTFMKKRAYTGFSKACGMKWRYRCWCNALQYLKWLQKLLNTWVQSLPIPGIRKGSKNLKSKGKNPYYILYHHADVVGGDSGPVSMELSKTTLKYWTCKGPHY